MIIGIVGTGTIGEILIEAFIESDALLPEQLIITNRNIQKARTIAKKHKRIKVAIDNEELVKKANLIMVCVKPKDLYQVVKQIAPYLTKNHCLISVTSPISTHQLESMVSCPIARFIPSITNRGLAGVTLYTFGDHCPEYWQKLLLNLFSKISVPIQVINEQTRIAADIASCGPAFFSFLAQSFIESAAATRKISVSEATALTEEMIIGLGELLKQEHYSLETLQRKVSVPGGITGEGLRVLEHYTNGMFTELFSATEKKFRDDILFLEKQFDLHY